MRVRLRKHEVELIADVLSQHIRLMKHAGVTYTGQIPYKIAYDKIREQYKKQVRGKEVPKRVGRVGFKS